MVLGFFRWFGAARSRELKYICSDMWEPYQKVIAKKAGQAVRVLDRFHIMTHFSKALDEVRARETRAQVPPQILLTSQNLLRIKMVIAEDSSQNPPPIPITPYSAGVPPPVLDYRI